MNLKSASEISVVQADLTSRMMAAQSINIGKKDDLVERVIESIKTLSKKEEEIKL
jgi:hypothetical protein